VIGVLALAFGAVWALCLILGARQTSVAGMDVSTSGPGENPLDVVINEIAWMGTVHSALDEWIELRNNTTAPILLENWHLVVGTNGTVALTGIISPGGYYLLERTDDATVSDVDADLIYLVPLDDNGLALTLTNGAGTVIDTVDCQGGWVAGSKNPDRSMERINPLAFHGADNWATNDGVTRNGVDEGDFDINGTPGEQNSCYVRSGLSVGKTGPDAVTPGLVFTSHIVLSNTSVLTAAGVVVSDVLPSGVSLVAQASPFTWMQPASSTLVWQVGVVAPGVSYAITLALRTDEALSGPLTNVVTATDDSGHLDTAAWNAALVPYVRIYALHPWALHADDEALALTNLGPGTVALSGWGASDGDTAPDVVLPAVVLPPGGVLWLADDADAFYSSFGFVPDLATSCATHTVPLLSGTWPGFANDGGQVVLYDGVGRQVDLLVYGDESPALAGWRGPAVSYPYAGFGSSGQILYRKLDEDTGRAVTDTNSAVDWANDATPGPTLYGLVREGDLHGKRFAYPGWDWDLYTDTFEVTATARVTVGIAPDNAYAVVAGLFGGAQKSILIEGYTFESVWLTGVLTERIAAGVQVTMLLEGGRLSDQELWNCQQIMDAGGEVFFMHNDSADKVYDRYTDQHAKFAIVDGIRVAIMSENFTNHAMPIDDKANGTAGNRGVVLITDQPAVVDYIAALFARDCDPTHHRDVVPYGSLPRYTVSPTYTAVYSTGGGGYSYMAPFSATMPAFQADYFQVIHAPETGLRYSDGLIGLLLRAGPGDEIYVEQMYERIHWGLSSSSPITDPNPRLEAYVQAERQGASVRVLLDRGFDRHRQNYETALYLLDIDEAEGLDLEVRLGNPTLRGIHNKMVLANIGGEKYVYVGSINGSEASFKANRELALLVRSAGAYDYLKSVWDYDWAHGGGPHEVYLPLIFNGYVSESDHVLISEVMFKQAGGAELGEWIELYNPTGSTVDIGGWRLGDAAHPGDYERLYAFPAGTAITAGGTLVVARQAAAYQALGYEDQPLPDLEWDNSNGVPDMVLTSWGTGQCALGNTGDEVILLDASMQVVDVLLYGAGSYPGVVSFGDVSGVYNGNSLERWPANRDSDDCVRDFRVRYTPGPGGVVAW
jgi:uncharacterized repeat protein (TIGR01451 family)